MNLVVGLVLLLAGVTILATGWLAVTDRLPRNHRVGIRTNQTLTNPELWLVAHREAGPWILAAGVADLLAGLGAISAPSGGTTATLACLAALFTLVLPIVGAAVATIAIRRPAP